ncbi:MAG: nucleotidyltransferase family protein [Desulfurococcaceae archaeon]
MPHGNIKAVILAGGLGTRFHPYTELIPKPMIPLGPDEKPVLEYIIKWISKYGIRKFVLLVNYRWKYIHNYFNNRSRFNVEITYSIDEKAGYGNTGGAILKAYRNGLLSERILIWYGDILAPIDIDDLVDYHVRRRADLTIVVTRRYKVPVGVAKYDENFRVIDFQEKPELDINAAVGIAVMETRVFDNNIESFLGKNFDFMGDFVPWMLKTSHNVLAYVYNGEWYDMGSLAQYKKLNMDKIVLFFHS